MFEQSGLSHPYITLTLHAYIWHLSLVFVGFYLIASKRAAKSLKDILPAFLIFLALAAVAQTINIVFADKGVKMFYISPYNSTPLIIFKEIEAACGWFVNMCLYIAALTLGAFLFIVVAVHGKVLWQRLFVKKYGKREE